MNPAKRGDLVVIEQHHRDYVMHGDNREYDTFTVGVVTSVTRDGHVKMYRRAGDFEQPPAWRGAKPDRGETVPSGMVRSYLLSAKAVDVASALATAACHVWVTDTAHEDNTKAYDSLAEVKAAMQPHLKSGTGWAALSAAAAVWEKARREASPMLSAALSAPRGEFGALSDAYHAAVTGANEAYRAACAEAAGESAAA